MRLAVSSGLAAILALATVAPVVAQISGSDPALNPDDDEIVVTGRRTGPPLAAGEWQFDHSPVFVRPRSNVGTAGTLSGMGDPGLGERSAANPIPRMAASGKRWRFCLPDSAVEEFVALLIRRGLDDRESNNCSRIQMNVTQGTIESRRNCSVTYYASASDTAGLAPSNIAGARQTVPSPANREFTATGRYTADTIWLRFDSEIRLSGGSMTEQTMQSTLRGKRLGECPAADR